VDFVVVIHNGCAVGW